MKRTLIAAAALVLFATTAHAASKPTLPKEFQGRWCFAQKTNDYIRADSCKRTPGWSWMVVKARGFEAQDGTDGPHQHCKLQSAEPHVDRYGKRYENNHVTFTFRCALYGDWENPEVFTYFMGITAGRLYMLDQTERSE